MLITLSAVFLAVYICVYRHVNTHTQKQNTYSYEPKGKTKQREKRLVTEMLCMTDMFQTHVLIDLTY